MFAIGYRHALLVAMLTGAAGSSLTASAAAPVAAPAREEAVPRESPVSRAELDASERASGGEDEIAPPPRVPAPPVDEVDPPPPAKTHPPTPLGDVAEPTGSRDGDEVPASDPAISTPRPEMEAVIGERPPVPDTARVRFSAREGLRIESSDSRFGLNFGLLGQARYRVERSASGEWTHGPQLRITRPILSGHLWGDRVTWLVLPELAGTFRLLDGVAIVNLHPAVSVAVGQYRPWFTRGFPTNISVLALPDRGTVLDAFRSDRDVGVTVLGRPLEGRLEYYVGVFDGEGLGIDSDAPRHPQPLVTARVVGAPLGAVAYTQTAAANARADLPWRFAVAGNMATNEVERRGTRTDPTTGVVAVEALPDLRTVTVGGDLALQGWRMVAMGEGFWRWSQEDGGQQDQAWGAYGLVSMVLLRRRLELVGRVGALRLEVDDAVHVPVEPGLNVYVFGDKAKLQLRYRCDVDPSRSRCMGQGAQLQSQLWF